MPLTINDMKILIRLLKNRLKADYDPDIENLLLRMETRLEKAESNQVSQQY